MIVRIATEGQYKLADEQTARLDELDEAVANAIDAGDEQRFQRCFQELIAFVRRGERLDDEHLGESDVILPPPDTSFTQAAGAFSADDLIPG